MTGIPAAARGMRLFVVVWLTQTLSLFGTFIALFGVNIWLTREVHPDPGQKAALALALTATTLATTAPLIALMPLAGAFADRHDRRRILIVTDLVSAALAAALAGMHGAGRLDLPSAVVLMTGLSVAGAFHAATLDSTFGHLVPEAQLQRASGMMQTSYALSQLLAPALAAVLIGVPALARELGGWRTPLGGVRSGVQFTFAVDAASFALSAAVMMALRLPHIPSAPRVPGRGLWGDVREGLVWIARRPPFVWLISFGSLANLMFAPLVLLVPLLVRDRLGSDLTARGISYEAGLALANTAMGLGGVVGGVLVSLWGGVRARRPQVMIGAMVVLGLGQVVAGAATALPWLIAGMFLTELLVPLLNTTSFALWQGLTPAHLLGRALASRRFIAQSFFPVGTMIAGWLAVPVEPWLVVTAAGASLTLVCAVQLAQPGFARLEDRLRAAAAEP
jgi:MFS family permease